MTEDICDRIINESKNVFVGPLDGICGRMEKEAPFGSRVLLVADFAHAKAERVRSALFKRYRVVSDDRPIEYTRAFARSMEMPEDVKAVIGAGDGRIAALSKYIAARYSRPLVFIATEPDIATALLPSAMLEEDGFIEVYKTEPPILTFVDSEPDVDERHVAAGFGEVCSRLVALFDYELSGLLSGEKADRTVCADIIRVVKSLIEKMDKRGADALTVARHAIAVSVIAARCGNSRLFSGGDTQVAHALALLKRKDSVKTKLSGENLMAVAVPVMSTYRAFLSGVSVLPVAVPDNNVRLDFMTARLGISPVKGIGKLGALGTLSESLKRLHIIKEYRSELSNKCRAYENALCYAGKLFKRIYSDKGYSYTEYMSRRELSSALYLAPEMREKFTALTLIKQFGYLENLMRN